MMPDREKVIKGLECCLAWPKMGPERCAECPYAVSDHFVCFPDDLLADAISLLREQEHVTGETSDGYHTFNELYHHRAVLFSVIVANYPDRAWKSKKHHDGTMYDNMFIVGINTPDGQATYHYDVDPYWDMFKCRVLDNAPEWDGHTPAQAIERIGKLKAQEPRVMTLEEVEAMPYGHVLIETDKKDSLRWLDALLFSKNANYSFDFITLEGRARLLGTEYNREWRCWTAKPTDEQREAVKWDETD